MPNSLLCLKQIKLRGFAVFNFRSNKTLNFIIKQIDQIVIKTQSIKLQ